MIKADPSPINEFEKRLIAKARKYTPELKVMTYIHTQLSSDAEDAKYNDCRLVDENGKFKNYYPAGGKLGRIFIPTLENAYGKRFLKLIDWYFENFDLDGLYMDETNHCTTRLYYGDKMWDKVSVELDKNNNVKRKISFVPLLKLQFTLKCMDKILKEHKKLMVGNFSPETRSELQYQYPRFEETYQTRWVYLSHLYTPIRLGDMLTYSNTPTDMAKDIRIALMQGSLYYHYLGDTGCPTITSYMYPFTPVELHEGWMMAEERILTALSGDFGWHGKNILAQTRVFDERGREVFGYSAPVAATADGTRVKLDLKPDHCAAIIATPVSAEIASGVTLHNIRYMNNGMLKCNARGKGKVKLYTADKEEIFNVDGELEIAFIASEKYKAVKYAFPGWNASAEKYAEAFENADTAAARVQCRMMLRFKQEKMNYEQLCKTIDELCDEEFSTASGGESVRHILKKQFAYCRGQFLGEALAFAEKNPSWYDYYICMAYNGDKVRVYKLLLSTIQRSSINLIPAGNQLKAVKRLAEIGYIEEIPTFKEDFLALKKKYAPLAAKGDAAWKSVADEVDAALKLPENK